MKPVVLFLALLCVLAAPAQTKPAPVIIKIVISETKGSLIDGKRCNMDSIAVVLERKMWSKYNATHKNKLQDKLKISFSGQVLMGVRGASLDQIQEAQQETLKRISNDKYGKDFEQLDAAQQDALKTRFKILFQELIW